MFLKTGDLGALLTLFSVLFFFSGLALGFGIGIQERQERQLKRDKRSEPPKNT